MSSTEQELTPEDLAQEVFSLIQAPSDDSTADTAAEAPEDTQVVEGEETDTGESRPEVVEDATGRLHGKDGKFVPKGDEAEEVEGSEEEPAVEQEEEQGEQEEGVEESSDFVIEVDDEETAARVQAVLEKYDGDPAKALVALSEAQSLIGRKGNEAAQANAELDALRAELAAIKQGQDTLMTRLSTPVIPITQDLIEQDPATAAQQAIAQDNVQALEAAITAWSQGTEYVEANPDAARFFLEKIALEAQMSELRSSSTTAPVEPLQAQIDAEVQKVLERHPDLEEHTTAIADAAKDNPILARAMETGTPVERAQALEALTVIAKSRTGSDTSREAMKRVQIRVKQEADEARANARVVSASRGSAAVASQSPGVDEFLEAFEARMGISSSKD